MEKGEGYNKIIEIIKSKASLKQGIYKNTLGAFAEFKKCAIQLVNNLIEEMNELDKDVSIEFIEKGTFEFSIKIGGDIILFQMHTNVFDFDQQHSLFKTSYVKENRNRSFCGIINIYNFLSDSMKYHRYEDSGYLIGRAFINAENHFFVEGRKKLNFIHNDFINETISSKAIYDVIEHAILYSMGFDLFTPPYKEVHEVRVGQLMHESSKMQVKTAKRMGYKFSFEDLNHIQNTSIKKGEKK
jgi:hypothetical protein